MSKYPKISKHKWITKPEFKELEIWQNVELNHFIGKAHIASAPSVKGGVDDNSQKIKQDLIEVQFTSGPWLKKNNGLIKVVRQHIKKVV